VEGNPFGMSDPFGLSPAWNDFQRAMKGSQLNSTGISDVYKNYNPQVMNDMLKSFSKHDRGGIDPVGVKPIN
jgi:hypothetical protein